MGVDRTHQIIAALAAFRFFGHRHIAGRGRGVAIAERRILDGQAVGRRVLGVAACNNAGNEAGNNVTDVNTTELEAGDDVNASANDAVEATNGALDTAGNVGTAIENTAKDAGNAVEAGADAVANAVD